MPLLTEKGSGLEVTLLDCMRNTAQPSVVSPIRIPYWRSPMHRMHFDEIDPQLRSDISRKSSDMVSNEGSLSGKYRKKLVFI